MTKQQIFDKLVAVATMPHGGADHPHPSPWTSADRLDQDALFAIQEAVHALLFDVAKSIGPKAELTLVAKLPWAFHHAKKG